MHGRIHFFAFRRNIDSLIAGAAGFFIILLFAQHSGIGISPDSVTYVSAARNFIQGKGLTGFDEVPLVDFPAFYPIFLATVSWITRLDPLVFGAVLNGLIFALLLYLAGSMMNAFVFPSAWYKRIILCCCVFSPGLLEIYSMLWSETVFLLLLLFFIIAGNNYFRKHTTGSLLLFSATVAFACVTRYVGVVLVCTGGILLIMDNFFPLKKRMLHLLVFSAGSCSLLVINLLRNRVVGHFLTGARQKGVTSLLQNIYYFGDVLCDWFGFPENNAPALILTVAGIGLCLFLFVRHFRKKNPGYTYEDIAALFCVIYSVFMILSATVSRYEQFTSRLLSPLFIPLLWCISWWMVPLAKLRLRWRSAGAGVLGLLLAALFMNHQLAADYETYDGVKDAGIPGYTEDPFPQSEIVVYLQQHKNSFQPGYTVYSNAGDAVYFFSGLTAHLLPQPVFPSAVQKFYQQPDCYVVWFNYVDNPDLLSLQDILKHKKMKLLQQFDSGMIYECE